MTTELVAKAAIDRRLAEIILPTVEGMGFELVRSSPLVFASFRNAWAGGASAWVVWSSSADSTARTIVATARRQRVCKADCSLGVGVCKIELRSLRLSSRMREA